MPLPHEQAAIERAQGRHRERLAEAAAVLDQLRATYPGVDMQQLPPDVRRDAFQALRAFHPSMRAFGIAELMLLLMLTVALALMWFKPVRVFRCESQGTGLARCVVTERLFGLVPLRQSTVLGIADASTSQSSSTNQSRDSDGALARRRPTSPS
jgi:hypothetical protein